MGKGGIEYSVLFIVLEEGRNLLTSDERKRGREEGERERERDGGR
jgi:hypothetical protein